MGKKRLSKRTYRAVSEFNRLSKLIEKIKTVEGLDIVRTAIENTYLVRKINDTQRQVLYTKLSDQASKVGEKKIYDLPREERTHKKGIVQLSSKVFIVHGRDHKPMKELKAMVEEFGLNPIVLHEQPSGSRTIVEKLEKYSDVGYTFVILTPDDVGGPRHKYDRHLKKIDIRAVEDWRERARQNVILEFGYFIGKLGRDKVGCLYKGDVELPSDMHGIVYIPFNESVEECRDKIIKELKAAGYEIKL